MDNPLITEKEFKNGDLAATITDWVNDRLPEEKVIVGNQLRKTAAEIRAMKLAPDKVDGRGLACLSIPPIVFQRWNALYPGCFTNKEFTDEFAVDNPECVLPGYKPKAKTVYFDMGHARAPSYGANFYHENKAKVAAQIKAQTVTVNSFKA